MSAESPNYAYAEAVRLRELGIRSAAVTWAYGVLSVVNPNGPVASPAAKPVETVAEQLERMNADFADCVAETVDRFEGG